MGVDSASEGQVPHLNLHPTLIEGCSSVTVKLALTRVSHSQEAYNQLAADPPSWVKFNLGWIGSHDD
jgi:hypothetical protein